MLAAHIPLFNSFNPRAPYGARLDVDVAAYTNSLVSTHAPRTGRGRTEHDDKLREEVSTHAPRTGRGVFARPSWQSFVGRFNPRAPYGARHTSWMLLIAVESGVSTHAPRTGRGLARRVRARRRIVSTHAPRTGRGAAAPAIEQDRASFNPRAPYGARPLPPNHRFRTIQFQPTRPVRGAAKACRRLR